MVTVMLQVLSEDVSVETLLYKQSQLRYVVLFDFSFPPPLIWRLVNQEQ